jgi:hypothetical protein
MTALEALAELMRRYDEYRDKWLTAYATDEGFDAWFAERVLGHA